MAAHLRCLAVLFLTHEEEALLPTTGDCPICNKVLKWPELIARKRAAGRRRAAKRALETFQPAQKVTKKRGREETEKAGRPEKKARVAPKKEKKATKKKAGEEEESESESEAAAAMTFGSYDEDEMDLPQRDSVKEPSLVTIIEIEEDEDDEDGEEDVPAREIPHASQPLDRHNENDEEVDEEEDDLPLFPRPRLALPPSQPEAFTLPTFVPVGPPLSRTSSKQDPPAPSVKRSLSRDGPQPGPPPLKRTSSKDKPLLIEDLDDDVLSPSFFHSQYRPSH